MVRTADNREVRRSNRRGPIPLHLLRHSYSGTATLASSGLHTYEALRAPYVDLMFLESITKIYSQFAVLIELYE